MSRLARLATTGRVAGMALLVLAVALAAVLRDGDAPAAPSADGPVGAVTVRVPSSVPAGTPVVAALDGVPPGTPVLVSGTAGATVVPVADDGSVTVPARLVEVRGRITFHVDLGLVASLDVRPGPAVDPIQPYVGPRSIIADTTHHTMLTVVPRDVFGNPVAAGTAVTIHVRRPDGRTESYEVETDGLLAWRRVFSTTLAGRTELRAGTSTANGPVADVLEVAGAPVPFALEAVVVEGLADGRSTIEVVAPRLADRFGNLLADGTEVLFELVGPDGRGTATTITVGGRASVLVRAPRSPGSIAVVAVAKGTRSTPLELRFAPVVSELPVVVDEDAAGRTRVRIGPVLDAFGAFVADGTVATVVADGEATTVRLVDGRGEVVLPGRPTGRIVVEVGRTSVEARP